MSCCSKCRFMRGRSLSGTRCISCWICRIYKLSSHTPSAIRLRTSSSWRATVCPLQLNAACLTKPLHRKRYLTWIEGGCVRYLGSDIHMLGSGYQDWEKCARLLEKRVP